MRDEDYFLVRYSPGSTRMMYMAFFDMPVAKLAEALFQRAEEMKKFWDKPGDVKKQAVSGTLASKLDLLLPLNIGSSGPERVLITSTHSGWTAYISNSCGIFAGDFGQADYMCKALNTRLLRISYTEDIPHDQPGGAQFLIRDSRNDTEKVRYVYALKESRWEFREYGERLSFEEIASYSEKNIRKRLTLPMLERYCRHFGIELLDPDFYAGEGFIIYEPAISQNTQYLPNWPNQTRSASALP